MTMIDFTNLHLYQENNRIEAKQAQGGLPHSIWETYSAFANTLGGIILLGVKETADKSFQSVRLSSPEWLADEFWQLITDGSHVNVNILTRDDIRIEESEGNRIVVIEVPKAAPKDRPVYIGSDPFSGSYRRNGEGDCRCTYEEVSSMLRDSADLTPDRKLISELSLNDLNAGSIIRCHAAISGNPSGDSYARLDFSEFLCQLNAAGYASDGTLHPTAAGLLLFGRYEDICRHFPGFSLCYREELPDSPASATQTCRLHADFDPRFGLNLYEFYTFVCGQFSRIFSPDTDTKLLQHGLKEALTNALVHADYLSPSKHGPSVIRTSCEIRFTNPGGFRVNVQDAVNDKTADPRNAVLSKIFRLLQPCSKDKRGLSAVLRIWEDHNLAAPRIREEFNPDRTTLILPLTSTDANQTDVPIHAALDRFTFSRSIREQQIVEILTNQPSCSLEELCRTLRLSKSWVSKILRDMQEKGLLTVSGKGRQKQYRLKA